MNLARFAVKRRVTVLMGVLVVLMLGAVSYGRVPIDLFPNMSFPMAGIIASYPGAGPSEVEALVTRPLEESAGTVANVRSIRSVSGEGSAVVIAEFEWGTNMEHAALALREQIDLIAGYLPAEVTTPTVIRFDPSLMPIMMVNMTGAEDPVALRRLANDLVKPRLERIDGVASVTVLGGLEEQVSVEVDQALLAANGLTWQGVSMALRGAGLNLPGGRVAEGHTELTVRSVMALAATAELEDVVVGMRAVAYPQIRYEPVRVKDIADVKVVPGEARGLSRLNGAPSVALLIQKTATANTVKVAAKVQAAMDELGRRLPEGGKVAVTMNQAEFITHAIDAVRGNVVWGALLAVGVLFLFLRSLRSVLVIACAVPISIVGTFNLLHFTGLTFNLMTLSGLALGVGMLVDNSIVVLENIVRHMQAGAPPARAATRGAAEVGMAITASTMTTVAVFLPVIFVGGLTGMLFKELALTVTFSLLVSLVVGISFVPAAAATLLGRIPSGSAASPALDLYSQALTWALGRRLLVLGVVTALVAGAASLIPHIGGEFLPRLDRGEITIDVSLPPGTTLERTDAIVRALEGVVQTIPEVADFTVAIGSGPYASFGRSALSGSVDTAVVGIKLKPRSERTRSTKAVIAAIAAECSGLPADIRLSQSASLLATNLPQLEVEVSGPDLAVIEDILGQVAAGARSVPGLTDVQLSQRAGRPELNITYDRLAVAELGLSPALIATTVKGALQGERVATYRAGSHDLPVLLRLKPEQRQHTAALSSLLVLSGRGDPVRLADVAALTTGTGPNAISRKAGQRTASLTASVEGSDLQGAAERLKEQIAGLDLPAGYTVEFGGEEREMREAFSGLSLALGLAVALVYMVMAALFESLVHPFTIMLTVPLAMAGSLAGLYLRGFPFSIPSVIGLVVLVGVIVNNAIVLVDYIQLLRKRGLPREAALVEAGRVRMRPILMTTLTTVLGLVPLAWATKEGAELGAPTATALIGGLVVGTALTLFVIPVAYSLVDDLGRRLSRTR